MDNPVRISLLIFLCFFCYMTQTAIAYANLSIKKINLIDSYTNELFHFKSGDLEYFVRGKEGVLDVSFIPDGDYKVKPIYTGLEQLCFPEIEYSLKGSLEPLTVTSDDHITYKYSEVSTYEPYGYSFHIKSERDAYGDNIYTVNRVLNRGVDFILTGNTYSGKQVVKNLNEVYPLTVNKNKGGLTITGNGHSFEYEGISLKPFTVSQYPDVSEGSHVFLVVEDWREKEKAVYYRIGATEEVLYEGPVKVDQATTVYFREGDWEKTVRLSGFGRLPKFSKAPTVNDVDGGVMIAFKGSKGTGVVKYNSRSYTYDGDGEFEITIPFSEAVGGMAEIFILNEFGESEVKTVEIPLFEIAEDTKRQKWSIESVSIRINGDPVKESEHHVYDGDILDIEFLSEQVFDCYLKEFPFGRRIVEDGILYRLIVPVSELALEMGKDSLILSSDHHEEHLPLDVNLSWREEYPKLIYDHQDFYFSGLEASIHLIGDAQMTLSVSVDEAVIDVTVDRVLDKYSFLLPDRFRDSAYHSLRVVGEDGRGKQSEILETRFHWAKASDTIPLHLNDASVSKSYIESYFCGESHRVIEEVRLVDDGTDHGPELIYREEGGHLSIQVISDLKTMLQVVIDDVFHQVTNEQLVDLPLSVVRNKVQLLVVDEYGMSDETDFVKRENVAETMEKKLKRKKRKKKSDDTESKVPLVHEFVKIETTHPSMGNKRQVEVLGEFEFIYWDFTWFNVFKSLSSQNTFQLNDAPKAPWIRVNNRVFSLALELSKEESRLDVAEGSALNLTLFSAGEIFTDIKGMEERDQYYVEKAYLMGIIDGYPKEQFKGDRVIRHVEFYKIIYHLIEGNNEMDSLVPWYVPYHLYAHEKGFGEVSNPFLEMDKQALDGLFDITFDQPPTRLNVLKWVVDHQREIIASVNGS